MSWRDSFLRQAISDFQMFRSLNRADICMCHKLHYLQMATEKLAKGYLCSGKSKPPAKTHYALVRLLKTIKGRPDIRVALGYQADYSAFATYIDSILPFAEQVEQLAPVGGNFDKLNPEYPWKSSSGTVLCPSNYCYSEFPMTDIIRFSTLIGHLVRVMT